MSHTVLVIGVTGSAASLGKHVVEHLRAKKNTKINVLVRKEKRAEVASWEPHGIKVFEGDLKDIESLKPAVQGVDTIVSCVQGGPDVIIQGQSNLLKVAVEAGVKRFYPSDYSTDLRKMPDGENVNNDVRKQFHKILESHNMRYVAVYNGVFMETAHGHPYNFIKMCFFDKQKIEYCGDEYTLLETTTVDDTAKYTVESIYDQDAPTHLCITGDVVTLHKWKQLLEEATGKPWTLENKGSPEALAKEWKEQMQTLGFPGASEWMPKMYKAGAYLGYGKQYQSHNERYPNVKPTSIAQYLKTVKL